MDTPGDDEFWDYLLPDTRTAGIIPEGWEPPSVGDATKRMDLPDKETRGRDRIITTTSTAVWVAIGVLSAVVIAIVFAGYFLLSNLTPTQDTPDEPLPPPTVTVTTTPSNSPPASSTTPTLSSSSSAAPRDPTDNTRPQTTTVPTARATDPPDPATTTAIQTTSAADPPPSSSDPPVATQPSTQSTPATSTKPVTQSSPPPDPQPPTISTLKCDRDGLSVSFSLYYNANGAPGNVTVNVTSANNPGIPSTFSADAQYASGQRHLTSDEPVTCTATVTTTAGTTTKTTTSS
jgi:hypothetical protein